MQNGLYRVTFQTPMGQGAGVVVVEDGTVRGGDSGMYYVGTFQEANNQFTATLRVRRHSNQLGIPSVFGIDDVNLTLQGTSTANSATVRGTSAQAPGVQFQAQLALIA